MIKRFILMVSILLSGCANHTTKDEQADTFANLGNVYAQSGRLSEAEEYFQKAHVSNPNKNDVLLKLASVQVQSGKYGEAKQAYSKILSSDSNNHDARYRMASVQIMLGDVDGALDQYQTLLAADNKDFYAFNGLGVILDNISKYKLAQACYLTGLKYAPQNHAIKNNLGISYALSGDIGQARYYLPLSIQLTSSERPKENLKLINQYYADIKNPANRQKMLADQFLIKSIVVNSSLVNNAVAVAKKWC